MNITASQQPARERSLKWVGEDIEGTVNWLMVRNTNEELHKLIANPINESYNLFPHSVFCCIEAL